MSKSILQSILICLLAVAGVLPVFGQGHLAVDGISLARPYDEVVSDFKHRGFYTKSQVDEGTLLLGKFWGFDRVAAVPLRQGDSCSMVMMIVPEPASPRDLFALYNRVRARVTEVYGVYGKEENLYIDEVLTDFSPIEARINAARYGQAILFTQFTTPDGQIDVSINQHEATGLGVFAIFRDKDYVDPSYSQIITVEENKAIEPTRFKGVEIGRPLAEVARDLKARGLRDEMSMLERWLYQKNNVVKLRGEFFDVPGCDVKLQGSPDVELINVSFPAMNSWRDLYGLYTSLRESLAVKYGSIYRNDDQVAGQTSNLEGIDTTKALLAIRRGDCHLETMLLNRYDNHAFKVVITYVANEDIYRVNLVYYTPQGLASHLGKSRDL